MWASGNVFLLANTVFALNQTLHSSLLMTEMPLWMKLWKVGRLANLIFCFIYNIIFLGMFTDLFLILYVYDKKDYGFFDVMEAMFFAYNLMLHFPIYFVNSMIIMKEFMLEFIQVRQRKDGRDDDMALGLVDLYDAWNDVFWVFNPLTYINMFINIFLE